jgi:RNA polymerase sigma-70 factor (ECF subfamily)
MGKSFTKLADDYRDRVYTFARYSLRHREEAEDVTQEVMVRLWQRADRGGLDIDNVGAWVMRVARNAVIDVIRRRRTRTAVIADEVDFDLATHYTAGPADTGDGVESREFREALETALARMEDPYRSILVMREIQGLQYQEICDALEIPLNTMKVYLHRGRRVLREALKGMYHHDDV